VLTSLGTDEQMDDWRSSEYNATALSGLAVVEPQQGM